MGIEAPRGAEDVLPGETEKWQRIEDKARQVFSLYNYREIRTPIFEDTSLFERSIGGGTDIVEKQMYTFSDKKGRRLSLRPEGTASVVRAYLEHKLYSRRGLNKFFYMGPFFRYERPQAGRKRQFYQVGAEAIGSDSPALDAEIVGLSLQFLDSLGLKTLPRTAEKQGSKPVMRGLHVALNSIGCSTCQPGYRKKLREFLKNHLEELCSDCRQRTDRNPLRVLDCKREKCISLIGNAPLTVEYLCPSCKTHFESVRRFLDVLGTDYRISPHLVRGLDYYTRTTFEVVHSGLGSQNALAGGGRFDRLVEEFGGEPTPAVGFAAGVERIALIMEREVAESQDERKVSAYIAVSGKEYLEKAMVLVNELRASSVSAEMDYEGRSLKSQFRVADKLGARFTIILGRERPILRDMAEGEQREMSKDEIVSLLRNKSGQGD